MNSSPNTVGVGNEVGYINGFWIPGLSRYQEEHELVDLFIYNSGYMVWSDVHLNLC